MHGLKNEGKQFQIQALPLCERKVSHLTFVETKTYYLLEDWREDQMARWQLKQSDI